MKVSCRWLKEYVDLGGMNGRTWRKNLTLSGIEVDAVEKRNQGVDGVVVGKVLECVQHPNADRLRLCQVDVGRPETLQIVCGSLQRRCRTKSAGCACRSHCFPET